MNKSIFDYESFSDFFDAVMRQRRLKNKNFSYRSFCKRLGLKSTSQIAMISTGKRTPLPKLLHMLCTELGLTDKETIFAQALVDLQRARRPTERKFCLERINYVRTSQGTRLLDLDTFELVSSWHYLALIELTKLQDFKPDPQWIVQRLGGEVDLRVVETSLALLMRLGLIERTSEGSYRATSVALTTPHNLPSAAIRRYHEQMLEKASNAIHTQSIEERFLCGVTMPIDIRKMNEARSAILEFRDRLMNLVQNDETQEVYHLGVQLFRLTETLAMQASTESDKSAH